MKGVFALTLLVVVGFTVRWLRRDEEGESRNRQRDYDCLQRERRRAFPLSREVGSTHGYSSHNRTRETRTFPATKDAGDLSRERVDQSRLRAVQVALLFVGWPR